MNTADDRLLLGLDAGGSSTTAMLAILGTQGWSPLGRGTSGAGNPAVGDASAALGHLDTAIADAFAQSGRIRRTVDSACLAVAGSDRASVREMLQRWAKERAIADDCLIVHDAEPLLAWAASGETAIALVSGTGSLAWGRDGEGQFARAGGWGPLLGDEGSGYWLALRSLQAVVRAVDKRGAATHLVQRLEPQLALSDWRELPARLQMLGRDRIAALAPLVAIAAEEGDRVASQLVAEAGRHLAEMVHAVATQLQIVDSFDQLAISGGVLLQLPTLQQHVTQRIEQMGLGIKRVERIDDPVHGAVELACQAMLR